MKRRMTLFMFLVAGAVAIGALSQGVIETQSQVAVGNAADMECTGNYDPTFQYPKINPKTKKQGLIGKPCQDTTSGHVTTGTCQAMGKCKGEKTDGEKPQLPELPKPQPKPPGEKQQNPCPAGAGTTTDRAITGGNDMGGGCPPSSSSGGFGSSILSAFGFGDDTTSGSSTSGITYKAASAWEKLLSSLGLGNESTDVSTSGTDGTTNTPASQANQNNQSFGVGQTVSETVRAEPIVSNGNTAQLAPSNNEESDTQTYVSPDLSSSGSTFTYQEHTAQSSAGGVLGTLSSTLRRMLDMIRGWNR